MESVVALFPSSQQATRALQTLKSRGFDRDNLGFACADVVAQSDIASATGISPEEGAPAGAGAVIKSALMGVAAGLALTLPVWALLSLIPATQVYSRGGMYAALFGVIGGLTMGGLFGAISGSDHGDYVRLLRGFGMPGADAERMYSGMQRGGVLVIARDESERRTDEASRLLHQLGAVGLDRADSFDAAPADETPLKSEGRQDKAAAEAAERQSR